MPKTPAKPPTDVVDGYRLVGAEHVVHVDDVVLIPGGDPVDLTDSQVERVNALLKPSGGHVRRASDPTPKES